MREVLQAIEAHARADGDRVALSDARGRLTYADLVRRVATAAALLADAPPVVGVMMGRDPGHVIVDLALASLDRTIVALPDFFSPQQWAHMIRDAGIGLVVTTAAGADALAGLGVALLVADGKGGDGPVPPLAPGGRSRRIVYTSGTTGTPKGVVLGEAQMTASLNGLAAAAAAGPADLHLSVLPFSLLLEQLAGLLLPLRVGARVHIAASPETALAEAAQLGATTSVVVPALLNAWVGGLTRAGAQAPASLRFVAVGGAPVGAGLTQAAWRVGLPVHEGYGLSECCSVVAVNRPGRDGGGSAGWPLDGVAVSIEDGEIVVRGPTVMDCYLGSAPTGGVWRTGDCGRLLPDGSLLVLGRKDDLIITAQGRNIHPEWIEPMLLADPAVRACALVADPAGPRAVVVTTDSGDAPAWLDRLQRLTATAPAYARPAVFSLIRPDQARTAALFTPDGRPRRHRILSYLKESKMTFHETLVAETAAQRQDFLAIPLIHQAVAEGVDPGLYRAFLVSAYHHVRHTVPLLRRALAACGPADDLLAEGLRDYITEEDGHDDWILADPATFRLRAIDAMGGDGAACRRGRPPVAVRAMVATAYHLIEEEGPYALLGMVHVLEGMSVALAIQAARSIQARLGQDGGAGFSYLISHGGLDVGHVDGFARLLDAIDTPDRRRVVIAAARDFYVLYGNVFRALGAAGGPVRDAA